MRNSRTSWTKELSLHFLVMLSHFSYRKKTQVVYSNKELQVLFKTLINFIRHITNKENISVDSLKFPPKSRGLIITEVILRVLKCKVSSLWNNHKSRSNYAIHTWCVRVLCLHLCLYNMCMYCLWRPENDTGPPERRGEERRGCWESSSGPPEEQPRLLPREHLPNPLITYIKILSRSYFYNNLGKWI